MTRRDTGGSERSLPERDRHKAGVRELVADPDVYAVRVAEQGGRVWSVYDKKRRRRVTVINAVDRATAAVAEGTIKALTTEAVAERPSLAWVIKIDRNARMDAYRADKREREFRVAMMLGKILTEQETLRHGPWATTRSPPSGSPSRPRTPSVA